MSSSLSSALPITPAPRTSTSSSSSSSIAPAATTPQQSSAQVTTAATSNPVTIPTSAAATSSSVATTSAFASSGGATSSSSASPAATTIPTTTRSDSVIPGITSIVDGPSASTVTQIVSISTTSATRNVAPTGQANTSFFANKGAVIGVFTVVGLIGAAVSIAIVTAFIRRRRAKKFDMDVAEAAREAAATSAAHHPFVDDDYTSYGGRGSGGGGRGGYTGYSSESHGTYEQPAMSHGGRAGESYVMSDVGGLGGTEAYDSRYPSVAAGAAGIGAAVGAAAMQRARSRKEYGGGGGAGVGDTQERTPYPVFATGPTGAHNQEMFDQSPSGGGSGMRYRPGPAGRTPNLLEAAGLLGGAGTAETGYIDRRLSDQAHYADLSWNASQGQGRGRDEMGYSSSPSPHATVPSRESYIGNGPYHVVYPLPPPQQLPDAHTPEPPTPSDDPFRRNTMPMPLTVPVAMPDQHAEEKDDAYGGYADNADADASDSHHRQGSDDSRYSDLHRQGRDGRASFQDEEDYGRQPRVLKVANE